MTREEANEKLLEIRENFEFNKEEYNNTNNRYTMIKKVIHSRYFMSSDDIDEMLDALNEFKEDIAALPTHYLGETSNDVYGTDYGLEDDRLNYYYWMLYTDKELDELKEMRIKTKFKEWIFKELYKTLSDENVLLKYVDCKLLELFMDGAIDWESLMKLTYSDCSL